MLVPHPCISERDSKTTESRPEKVAANTITPNVKARTLQLSREWGVREGRGGEGGGQYSALCDQKHQTEQQRAYHLDQELHLWNRHGHRQSKETQHEVYRNQQNQPAMTAAPHVSSTLSE